MINISFFIKDLLQLGPSLEGVLDGARLHDGVGQSASEVELVRHDDRVPVDLRVRLQTSDVAGHLHSQLLAHRSVFVFHRIHCDPRFVLELHCLLIHQHVSVPYWPRSLHLDVNLESLKAVLLFHFEF